MVDIEAQDWWTPIPGIEPATLGHLHLAVLDWPTGPVTGRFTVVLRVTSHDNLAHLNLLKYQDDSGKGSQVHRMDFDLSNDDPFEFALTIDSAAGKDGWRIGRLYAQAEHANGNLQVARPTLPFLAKNGKAVSNAGGSSQWRPTSWYKEASPALDWGYALAAVARADLPIDAPVPADWSPLVQVSRNDKGGSPPIARYRICIDPHFHDGDEGRTVKAGNGPFKGRVQVPVQDLAPGPHRLVILATQVKGDKEHSVVGAFPFTV